MTSVNPPTTNYALRAGQGPGKEKRLEFYYADQNGRWQEYVSNNDVLITDKWQHVSASYTFNNAGTAKLYVNGEVVPGTWVNGSGYDEYSDQSFKGLIADVRLYNRIVTPQEIKQLFSSVRLPEGTYR
jgi:hypothetical protein